jgi:hypothetical protein
VTGGRRAGIVQNAIFNLEAPEPASPRKKWLSNAAIFSLTTAATAVMMLCPCDIVVLHDHYAVLLVAIAFLLGIAAAYLVYGRMKRDSGMTAFLRAVIALALVGASVYLELFAAMEIVAWMARRR